MSPPKERSAVREIVPFQGLIDAVVRPPGSKSITNRALLAACLANGTSVLTGVLFAEDTEAMFDCIRAMGAGVLRDTDGTTVTVNGVGGCVDGFETEFYARQSGTTARFIAATLALGNKPLRLDADDVMRARPMGETFEALERLGVSVEATGGDKLPVVICGPVPESFSQPVVHLDASVSSQFTSGLLLAGACMPAGLILEIEGEVVSRPYLDMTVAVMNSFGASVSTPDINTFVVLPGGYTATNYDIEPDASAASYFFAAAAICGGKVTVDGLGATSMQGDVAFVDVLARMGCLVEKRAKDITVTGGPLNGVEENFSQISDTAQTIAAVAVFAEGPTTIKGIGFIRNKETDRIAAVVAELLRLGIDATELEDGFRIQPGMTTAAVVETYEDHRMAMSFALIGLRCLGVSIADPNCVAKTFPTYFDELERLRPEGVV